MNIALTITTCLLLIFTVLPLIRNDYWIFRVFDYPRLQKLFLNGLAVVLLLTFYSGNPALKYLQLLLLGINIVYLLRLIIPFTPLGNKQVLKANTSDSEKSL